MLKDVFTHKRQQVAGQRAGSLSGPFAPYREQRDECAWVRPAARLRATAASLAVAAVLICATLFSLPVQARAASILNQAWLYGDSRLLAGSSVQVATAEQRTPATLTFYVYRPGSDLKQDILVQPTEFHPAGAADGSFTVLPPPVFNGESLPLATPLPLVNTQDLTLHGGEPLFMTLADGDQNLDPARLETVLVTIRCNDTGDLELLRLTETGPDTGVFSGYLMTTPATGSNGYGNLQVAINCQIDGHYTDIIDNTDTSTDAALVDPLGIVFDSRTGEPVNGVKVTLYDVTKDRPASDIRDDNGQLGYPSTVVTGDPAFGFPPGGFRFPLIEPYREYRFDIEPTAGYSAPSTVDAATLRTRFAQYLILDNASYGGSMPINPGPAIRLDIPIDPSGEPLWLRKQADREIVAVGDFLRYTLTLQNADRLAANGTLRIEDRLPLGFRYKHGSLRIAHENAPAPLLSEDGRTMTISIDSAHNLENLPISYIVEVASGARTGEAINTAVASDNSGNASNTARARVIVRDDFFRNSSLLLGRVMVGSCDMDDTEKQGLANVRIYLEDGSFVDTDQQGKYHFEGIEPGIHVVQVDTLTLPQDVELLPCEESSQTAGRTFSQFVDLQGGTLWRVDFHAAPKYRPPTGEVSLVLNATLDGDEAVLTAVLRTESIPAHNLKLNLMLPSGFAYTPATARRDGTAIEVTEAAPGSLAFALPELAADNTTRISVRARLEGTPAGAELPARAVLSFDGPTGERRFTPPAETRFGFTPGIAEEHMEFTLHPRFPSFGIDLQATDLAMHDRLASQLAGQKILRLEVVGHTDSQQIAPRSRHIFADNQALSVGRARIVATLLRERLGVAEDVITVRGMGDTMPVADNATPEGMAQNRRVEISLVSANQAAPAELTVTVPASPEQTVLIGEPAGDDTPPAPPATSAAAPALQTGLLSPADGHAVNHIEAVRLRLDTRLTPRLSVDGIEVPNDRIGFRMTEQDSGTTLYSYIGVDFGKPGTRKLLVEGIDPFGNPRFSQTAELVRTGKIASMRLIEEGDNLADGRTPVRVRVELIDEFGRRVEVGTTLGLDRGKLFPVGTKVDGQLEDSETTSQYRHVSVDRNGWIIFNPVDRSGFYPLKLKADGATLDTEIFVKPHLRDWILVGFAEGTMGYRKLSGNSVSLDEAEMDEHYYDDGQVKFFAKGAIKGEWLLTLAYDSDKPDLDGESLHQIIDPDSYYPLYGDGTREGYEAASASKLFVKLERDQFSALFGDMNTGLDRTELARYNRSMNGFKVEQQAGSYSFTAFAADTKQSFARDELRGDGTSGRYYLTRKDLVINSESVTIETRDRFHSERILDSRELARHTDYDIDYDAGSLFFKQPVPSKDPEFNPVYIVIRYETKSASGKNYNYGGRVAANTHDRKFEVGATYVHEETGNLEGDLYGADVTVKLTPQTTLRAEAATTSTSDQDDDASGEAYLAEIRHETNRLQALAYYREQHAGFGLGQLSDSEAGMRKYGAETTYHVNQRFSVSGLAYHEDNLSSNAKRDVAEVNGRFKEDRYGAYSGLREARDRFADGEKLVSTQWLVGANWVTPDRKLNLRGDYEQSLGSKNDNGDFPTLLTLGADYRLTKRISVFAEQEFSWGAAEDTVGSRAGFKANPWEGGEVHTTFEQQRNENDQRVFALFGLGQSWQVTPRWSVDASIDRSYTIKDSTGQQQVNDKAPAVHGADDDFTAVSVGATYRKEKWTWWNRLEIRQADNEDKYGVSTGIVGEPRDGVAVSAKALAFITDVANGTKRTDGDVRLGMAYRPATSRWVFLNRLDFYFEKEAHGSADYDNWRIVNHLHANFRLNRKLQMSFYYGLKYVRDNYDGRRYSGYTDMLAFETRYNINKRWDVGLHGALLYSWESSQFLYSLGADIGFSPMTNAWISLGYNLVGFEDQDFSDANYTAEGAYLRFRAKFDQQSVRDAAEWLNR